MTYRLLPGGRRQERREPSLRHQREATTDRSGHGCEWRVGCPRPGTDTCHGWGRGNVLSTVLADQPALAWKGCRSHHKLADGHRKPTGQQESAELEDHRLWLVEMALAHYDPAGEVERQDGDRPVDIMRRLERVLEARGTLAEMRLQRRE